MIDTVSIRPAALADAPTLAPLYRDAYGSLAEAGYRTRAADADRADCASWIRNARVYVAVDGGRIVGSVRYRTVGTAGDGPEFGKLAVPERHRGDGVGSALIAHVERLSRREGADRIRLRTFTGHPFLPALYRRRGYREVDVTPLESRSWDILHMAKEL